MNAVMSTHATIMHFAIFLPDWNSLDSVRRAHNDLEGAALMFFALLVVFDVLAHLASKDEKREKLLEKIGLCCFAVAVFSEIVAYPYGQRNDTLSEQVIGSLDVKARNAANNASAALSNSEEAESKSSEALDKAGKAQEKAGEATGAASNAFGLAKSTRQQEDQLRVDLDKANVDAKALQEKLEAVNKQTWPRLIIDPEKFVSTLRAAPNKAHVRILFTQTDSESWEFAVDVWQLLGTAGRWGAPGAGWEVDEPQPIPPDGGDERPLYKNAPLPEKWGAWPAHGNLASRSGIGFLLTDRDLTEKWSRAPFSKEGTALEALVDAFSEEHFSPAIHTYWQYPPVPKGTIILVVGQIR